MQSDNFQELQAFQKPWVRVCQTLMIFARVTAMEGVLTFTFRNAFVQGNVDLRFAGKTDLPSVENERPTEMSRNKRPALNAATITYTVSMNYPRITLQAASQLPSACVDHYRAAIKALFTSDDQVLLTSAIIDRT